VIEWCSLSFVSDFGCSLPQYHIEQHSIKDVYSSQGFAVRAQFGDLFDGVDMSISFNGQDQAAVAHAVVFMLKFRMVAWQT